MAPCATWNYRLRALHAAVKRMAFARSDVSGAIGSPVAVSSTA